MRYILATVAAACLAMSITGCKDTIEDYSGENGIYFSVLNSSGGHLPSTEVTFLNVRGEDTLYSLRVNTCGEVVNYDRSVAFEIVTAKSTAIVDKNYQIVEQHSYVRAGENYADLKFKLLRADNINNESKELCIKLLPNEHFKIITPIWYPIPGVDNTNSDPFAADEHTLVMNNFVVKPASWTGYVDKDGYEVSTWGEFSQKKYELMCRLLNLTYDDFNSANMPTARKNMIAEVMSRYLINLKNGYPETQPELEEDGRLMYFSGCPWKSKPGVAWIPENE